MPEGCDTVIMQEQAEVTDDTVRIDAGNRTGQNVRQAGEDLAIGDIALCRPANALPLPDIGLLASMGIGEISCGEAIAGGIFFHWRRTALGRHPTGLKAKSMTATAIPCTAC